MTNPKTPTPTLTNRGYDRIKFFALVLLPGLGALYFGLGQIWGFPKMEEVVGSITVIDTFLGLLIRNQNQKYYRDAQNFDGEVIVEPDDGGSKATVSWNEHPIDLVDDPGKHSLELKVVRVDEQPQ